LPAVPRFGPLVQGDAAPELAGEGTHERSVEG
jgi:hypothetical protein